MDLLRRGAADVVQMNPHDPSMKELITNFMNNGGTVWACPPCSSVRGYCELDFIDGVAITGAGPVYDLIRGGCGHPLFVSAGPSRPDVRADEPSRRHRHVLTVKHAGGALAKELVFPTLERAVASASSAR